MPDGNEGERYYYRIDDIQCILRYKEDMFPDPEKWWSEEHTKIRIWQQWGVDHIIDELLNANPYSSTMEILYNIYDDLLFKARQCDEQSEQHCMYMYAKKVTYLVSELLDPDDNFYYKTIYKLYTEEDYDYDDEW